MGSPEYEAAVRKIMRSGKTEKVARTIIASSVRRASAKAKRLNPRLRNVK